MNKDIIKLINDAGSIAIFPHVSADGDAIGSSLALALALKTLDKHVVVYIEENIPDVYKFLPGLELTKFIGENEETMDLNIALDTGDVNRLGERAEVFFCAAATINIDHHVTNSKFAHLNYVDEVAASTGEIIFRVLKGLGIQIEQDVATCLYTAVATDTGGFKYGNTTAETHRIAAELLATGIDIADLSQKIFDNTTYQKVKLTKKAIELLEFYEDSKVAVVSLSTRDFQSTGAKDEDCDGIVNIGRSIEGVEVSILIKEKDNGEVKVNFRSKAFVDVAEIATAFGGGGHTRAAGCTVSGDINDIKRLVLEAVKLELDESCS